MTLGLGFTGHVSIWLAMAFNVVAGICFLMVARGNRTYQNLARLSYNFFMLFVTVAVAYLFYLFFSHDFAFKYVFDYSDRSLSFFYLLSAFWGGQEGTYLLWLFLSGLFGYILQSRGAQYKNHAMVIYTGINFFFLLLLLKLSPFAPLEFFAEDGAGLNPLLQDAWMVVHPPVIFVGYAMAAVPFALAMAALLTNDFSAWIKRSFPWVAITALMLAAGNVMGGYWAYKTLGWGGYWAWDPVENSSLVPWLVSLALIHGLLVERRSGALRKTNILMTALLFVLVIYGTFLTRSGVLSDFSVHSFVDLGVNNYLIAFLLTSVLFTLVLFIPRIRSIGGAPLNYNYYGKQFLLFAGMLCLFIFSMIVLFWSSLPILSSLVTDQPRAADLSTYNDFALPLAVVFSLLLAASPYATYNSFVPARWKIKLLAAAVISAVVGFGLFYAVLGTGVVFAVLFTVVITGMVMYLLKAEMLTGLLPALVMFILTLVLSLVLGVGDYMYLLYFALAAMVIVSNLIAAVGFLPGRWKNMGGQLTHFGFGIMLIGILGSSAFSTSEKLVIPRGENQAVYDLAIGYEGMEHDISYPKNQLILNIEKGGSQYQARPELYYSQRMNGIMRKPFIRRSLLNDYYLSPEQVQEMGHAGGLHLARGGSQKVGPFTVTFNGYEMSEHGAADGGMRVVALVSITDGDSTYSVQPAKQVISDAEGHSTFMDMPASFGENGANAVFLDKIEADQGAVLLSIPGLTDQMPPDQLIIDVSKKPMINLVWAGTTIIMIGGIIAFYRRRSELYS